MIDGVFMCTAGTSKAGMDMMTKVMALELGPHQVGIKVSCSSTQVCLNLYSDSCECSKPNSGTDCHGSDGMVRSC